MSKLSVVIPVYNVSSYIDRCLISLLSQSYKDLEIILVNDGSTDNSLEICNKYQKLDDRIIIIDKKNGGLSSARNAGLNIAKCDYIAFLDSDDHIENDMYELLMQKILVEKSDVCMCDVFLDFDKSGKKSKVIRSAEFNRMITAQEIRNEMIKIYPTAWNKVYRRALFTENKIEYPHGLYYEDAEVNFKLLTVAKNISRVDRPLYHYIQRAGSLTKSKSNSKMLDIFVIFSNIKKYLINTNQYDKYKEQYDFMFTRSCMIVLLYANNIQDKKERCLYIDTAYKEFSNANIKTNHLFNNYEKILFLLSEYKLFHHLSPINMLRLWLRSKILFTLDAEK